MPAREQGPLPPWSPLEKNKVPNLEPPWGDETWSTEEVPELAKTVKVRYSCFHPPPYFRKFEVLERALAGLACRAAPSSVLRKIFLRRMSSCEGCRAVQARKGLITCQYDIDFKADHV